MGRGCYFCAIKGQLVSHIVPFMLDLLRQIKADAIVLYKMHLM